MSILATDKFYYIMDCKNNYYRIDSQDQLVAADDETEATFFSFMDAKKRIGDGAKSKFYFMTPANIDADVNKEDEAVEQKNSAYEPQSIADVIISTARELTEAELPEEVEKSMSEYDLSKIDWKEYLTHFIFIATGLKEYRAELIKAESDVDQKICDVLHYIELCDISDGEAEDLVELLKVCRENRRDIKDEIVRVDSFQRNLGTSANVAKAKEALKSIRGLETRKYTPRKFAELFEGSEIKERKTRVRTFNTYVAEAEHREEILDDTEEELQMKYVRKATVFDGKENDWMAFAMQQAEFYKNAKQYIINIRSDIDEIDGAIIDLMGEIEVSNCNVTQGYKLFKRLKDLRLERKQKEKELECLYILTEHFDMDAMAYECENNVDMLEEYLYGKGEDTFSVVTDGQQDDVTEECEQEEQTVACVAV